MYAKTLTSIEASSNDITPHGISGYRKPTEREDNDYSWESGPLQPGASSIESSQVCCQYFRSNFASIHNRNLAALRDEEVIWGC
jgi:hypothetical protein